MGQIILKFLINTSFLLMFDKDYLYEAKLLDIGGGNWISTNKSTVNKISQIEKVILKSNEQ